MDLYVGPAIVFIISVSCLILHYRRNDPKNVNLIRNERVVKRDIFSRACRTVLVGFAVIVSLSMLTTGLPGKMHDKITRYYADTPNSGKRAAAHILQVFMGIGFAVFCASFFDSVGNAATWLGATRRVIARFAAEVEAVAAEAAESKNAVSCPAAVEVAPSIGAEGTMTVSAVEVANPQQRAAVAALAKIKRSFDRAWRMTQATNNVFAVPLSTVFVMCLFAGVHISYQTFVVGEGGGGMTLWAIMLPAVDIALLLWVSTAGDAYLNARAALLRPDTSLALLRVLGRDEAAVLAASLQRTQLGFALVNVIVTSQRVLYTIFSMMVVAVYLIPK